MQANILRERWHTDLKRLGQTLKELELAESQALRSYVANVEYTDDEACSHPSNSWKSHSKKKPSTLSKSTLYFGDADGSDMED